MKLTKKRKEILEYMKKNHGLITARDLAAALPEMDQATVYRNLDLFVGEGVVSKYVFDGSESQYEYAEANHHHAICDDCSQVRHIHVSDKEILKRLDIKDFNVESVELVVRGRCRQV